MKNPLKLPIVAASAVVLSLSTLSAVETDPVGYVSFDAASNSDLLIGVPLTQAPVFSGAVSSLSGGELTFAAEVPDLMSSDHYMLVTTDGGALEGQWFTITASGASSITVAENLASLGITASDTVSVFPFWTLDTLFPSGGGVPASSNVLSPSALVLTNDVTASGVNLPAGRSYLYHSGGQLPAGWYDANDLGGGSVGGVVLTPETYITIRNNSGSSASIVFSGSVPMDPIANNVVSSSNSRQDNQVVNPLPASFKLGESNLISSGAFSASSNVLSPVDRLFVYPTASAGLRPAPEKIFIFHSGGQLPVGWYDENNLGGGSQDDFEIQPGAALVIRRAQAGDTSVAWSPSLPYSL